MRIYVTCKLSLCPWFKSRSCLPRFILKLLVVFNEKWLFSLWTNFPLEFYYWNHQNKSPWIFYPTWLVSWREDSEICLKKKKALHIRNIYGYLRQQLAVSVKFLFSLFFFWLSVWGVWCLAFCKTNVTYGGLVLCVTRKVYLMNKKTLRQRADIDGCVYALDTDREWRQNTGHPGLELVFLLQAGFVLPQQQQQQKMSSCNNSHSVRALLSHTLFRHYWSFPAVSSPRPQAYSVRKCDMEITRLR